MYSPRTILILRWVLGITVRLCKQGASTCHKLEPRLEQSLPRTIRTEYHPAYHELCHYLAGDRWPHHQCDGVTTPSLTLSTYHHHHSAVCHADWNGACRCSYPCALFHYFCAYHGLAVTAAQVSAASSACGHVSCHARPHCECCPWHVCLSHVRHPCLLHACDLSHCTQGKGDVWLMQQWQHYEGQHLWLLVLPPSGLLHVSFPFWPPCWLSSQPFLQPFLEHYSA